MDIRVLKTVGGEEIVGKVIEDNEDHFVMEKPLGIAMTQQGLQMVPSLFTNDMEVNVKIYKAVIGFETTPRADVEEGYIQATTGIAGAGSKQIITG